MLLFLSRHGSKQKGIDALKGSITYIFSKNFAKKSKVDSYGSFSNKKNIDNVIILIKSVLNKDKISAAIKYFFRNGRIN